MFNKEVIKVLTDFAPLSYQESYDNSGWLVGDKEAVCTGILCSLDVTEGVVEEAIEKKCNLVVAHHPIIFSGIKSITGKSYVERTVLKAIKNDIAIYALHTNLDNVLAGVNNVIADKLLLVNKSILVPKTNQLTKLVTYIPFDHLDTVRDALFKSGAGAVGNYDECSFIIAGQGTFKANDQAKPYIGTPNNRHYEKEYKLEVLIPNHLAALTVEVLKNTHPYDEVAYELIPLKNPNQQVGSGMIGELEVAISELDCLNLIQEAFNLKVIKHTLLLNKPVKKIAVCGGSGSEFIGNAIAAGADWFITSDIKYHSFFDADNRIVVADIGHWESEQYTPDLLVTILKTNFPTFAILKSSFNTNPVSYFTLSA